VIFIGGGGASVFFDHRGAHTLARATHAAGGVVAAICIAPSVLARAGLLSGVHATAFPTQQEDLRAHGALWSDDPVCLDGSIITASGPQAAGEFGVSIADALASMDRKGAR
jgi:protease I